MQQIVALRASVDQIYVDDKIEDYIVDLVFATRDPRATAQRASPALIDFGASPRASLALYRRGQRAMRFCAAAPT